MRPEILILLRHERINHGTGDFIVGHIAAVLIIDAADFLAIAVKDNAGMIQVVDILQIELLCPFLILGRDRGEQGIPDEAQRDGRHTYHHADAEQRALPPAGRIAVNDYFFLGGTALAAAVCRCFARVLVVIEVIHT